VLSRGGSGLYRSLLSLWKLEIYPDLVTILSEREQLGTVEKSIFTVSEDTGIQGPETRVLETRNRWRTQLVEDSAIFGHENIGFLVERDMFLPNYSKLIDGEIGLGSFNVLSHFQRQRFGNSKLFHPSVGAKVGLSTLILSRSLISTYSKDIETVNEAEIIIPEKSNLDYSSREPMVLIQSNRKSPYEM
jgi:hypothetical protein